jgi:hypothetical protein
VKVRKLNAYVAERAIFARRNEYLGSIRGSRVGDRILAIADFLFLPALRSPSGFGAEAEKRSRLACALTKMTTPLLLCHHVLP